MLYPFSNNIFLLLKFQTDNHLKQYLHIIKDSPVYPIIYDSNNVVLSMPPIINGDHSKISVNTKNVFIECTGTDLTKTKIVLDTIVTMFSVYCAEPFIVESADVIQADGSKITYPTLKYRNEIIDRQRVLNLVGFDANTKDIASLLSKMCLDATAVGNKIFIIILITS